MGKEKGGVFIQAFVVLTALIFMAVGALIILGSFVPGVFSVEKLWPLFMLIPVVFILQPLISRGKDAEGTLVPIVILTSLTVYFLILNYTSWTWVSKTWPTFMLIPALGLFALFLSNRRKELLIPVGILSVLSFIFYGVAFGSALAVGVLFILAGVIIVARLFIPFPFSGKEKE